MAEGLLDTNVIIHGYTHDDQTEECARLLSDLENGRQFARVESYILHELSYAWKHYFRRATRDDIAEVLLAILAWPGVEVQDRLELARAVRRWQSGTIGFVDALLIERALAEGVAIFTKNVRDFEGQGVDVPDPLPRT
jgi:predicted nucleic-acid-binding protein